MKVCVIGTGYVGLVAGTCFADSGNDVICVDIDERKIEALKKGEVPIYEPGLEEMIRRNLAERRLWFTTDLVAAVRASDICFIAVGTPEAADGSADLRAVLAVASAIGEAMNGYRVIVCKSTVPVGTADQVRAAVQARTVHDFDVVSNPEFLKEGAAIDDFLKPDRVVIGGAQQRAIDIMKELYAPFVRTENPILVMDNRSAEMTKYAANAFLATKISFVNEIANLCERVGADVNDVRRGMGSDRRIGHHFLFPGAGYGGSCFPKDVQAIIRTAKDAGMEFPLLNAVEVVNERQKHLLVEKVVTKYGPSLAGRRFSIWGLSFKARTDDMREAPSIVIIEELLKRGARVEAHDPEALGEARKVFGERVNYHRVSYDALAGTDALLVVTDWSEFRRPDFVRMKSLMKTPVVFDGRNLYEPEVMRAQGFTYYPIGRTAVEGER
ncbi:MAG: UDP-glucose 6-dehydrogenase [Polyangiaceae bacterium UTPRO1]|nr:UDP-glucose/GDP-mannose dehydrogenase family protein [Myxococcales bacterium]OQY66938.1 MAG: UDP-glucose 6-dehydrogenase [Polyangiaceae bacterium UTPRO1]